MTSDELRARDEIDELGPEPADPHEHAMWTEERRGACVRLAGLADWRADLCRKAALDGDVWISPAIARLLLDAAEECRKAGGPR